MNAEATLIVIVITIEALTIVLKHKVIIIAMTQVVLITKIKDVTMIIIELLQAMN